MSLLVRINLALIVVFLAGASAAGWATRMILEDNARREVTDQARLMMESATAARDYTSREIQPLLQAQLERELLPQSVPSYAATTSLAQLRQNHPEYWYKEATLNPTNPRDRAADWERDVIDTFRNDGGTELIGERQTQNGPSLYLAHPLRVSNAQCLVCHSTPAAAPASLRAKYGEANGFGWGVHEIIGSQIVSVPLSAALKKADTTFRLFMTALAALFATLFIAVNLLLYLIVLRPMARICRTAERVSAGDMAAPSIMPRGRDEIAQLARAFEKMRRSLEKSLALLQQ